MDEQVHVSLALRMDEPSAQALVREIDTHKQGDNIGAVAVNVRHVMGVIAAGFEPEAGSTRWHSAVLETPGGMWWPWAVAVLLGYLAAGAAIANLTSTSVVRVAYSAAWAVGGFLIAKALNIRARGPRRSRHGEVE